MQFSHVKNLKILSFLLALAVLSGCAAKGNRTTTISRSQAELMKAEAAIENQQRIAPSETMNAESSEARAQADFSSKADTIAPGYLIAISSNQDQKLNGSFRVDFEGNLKLPYSVKIAAAGLTKGELSSKVNSSYAGYFRTAPNVGVSIKEKKYFVDVQGLVEKPGRYLLGEDESLDVLISKAGGLQKGTAGDVDARFARLQIDGQIRLVNMNDYYAGVIEKLPVWSGGDSVFFQSQRGSLRDMGPSGSQFVQMMGEVREPGEYHYESGADFFYYLVRAKGPTERANINRVRILRPLGGARYESIEFDMDQEEPFPPIESGDTVILQAENPTQTEKDAQLASTYGQVLATLATLALLFVTI